MMIANYKASGHSLKPVLGVILRASALYSNLDLTRSGETADRVRRGKHATPRRVHRQQQLVVAVWKAWARCRSTRPTCRAGTRTPPGSTPTRRGPTSAPPATCCRSHPTRVSSPPRRPSRPPTRPSAASLWRQPRANRLEAYATTFFNKYKYLSNGKYVLHDYHRIERQQVLRALIMCGPDGYLH